MSTQWGENGGAERWFELFVGMDHDLAIEEGGSGRPFLYLTVTTWGDDGEEIVDLLTADAAAVNRFAEEVARTSAKFRAALTPGYQPDDGAPKGSKKAGP